MKTWWNSVKEGHGYACYSAQLERTRKPFFVESLAWELWNLSKHIFWSKIVKCQHGKHWVDEGYGDPDSGGDGGHCTRCGFSFWVQYY